MRCMGFFVFVTQPQAHKPREIYPLLQWSVQDWSTQQMICAPNRSLRYNVLTDVGNTLREVVHTAG